MMINGTLIKESISDENILDLITIDGVEIWKADNHTANQPKYWTAIFFSTKEATFCDKLSKVLLDEWYVDLSHDNIKVLVFKDKVIEYTVGDNRGKEEAISYCRKIGLPEMQIDWGE